MLKHRVQHPPPATQPAQGSNQSLTVPPGTGQQPRFGTPTRQAQPHSEMPGHPSSGTPTHTQPRPETQSHVQPRLETQSHVQPRLETQSHVQPRPDTQSHVQYRPETQAVPGPQALINNVPRSVTPTFVEGRSGSFSVEARSDTLNNVRDNRSGSFSAHVPQSRSEYSITNNYAAHGDGMSMSSSYDAKEGVKRITEKYDSIGNLSGSPYRSPIGSPGMDGVQFNFTDIIASQKYREGMTEQDILQIETFYKSHKSEVHVCGCLANMYVGSVKSTISNDEWTFSNTGIPLLLLDTGEHRRERKLFIILAEKGTGFTLWRDVIDKLTTYRTPNANFHTMRISTDHTRVVGFSFDDAAAAAEFYSHIDKLTADPNDELLTMGKLKKKKSMKDKTKKIKLPKKSEISQPCCFVHVTKLDRPSVPNCDEQSQYQQPLDGKQPQQQQQQQQKQQPEASEFISQPFNFQHFTAKQVPENDVNTANLSCMVESNLTIDSNESVDSGLPDDRNLPRTEKT